MILRQQLASNPRSAIRSFLHENMDGPFLGLGLSMLLWSVDLRIDYRLSGGGDAVRNISGQQNLL